MKILFILKNRNRNKWWPILCHPPIHARANSRRDFQRIFVFIFLHLSLPSLSRLGIGYGSIQYAYQFYTKINTIMLVAWSPCALGIYGSCPCAHFFYHFFYIWIFIRQFDTSCNMILSVPCVQTACRSFECYVYIHYKQAYPRNGIYSIYLSSCVFIAQIEWKSKRDRRLVSNSV